MNARRILTTSAVATAAVLLSIGVQTLAYTAPTAAPTANDADAPLTVGAGLQAKTGTLNLNSTGASTVGLTVNKDLKTINGYIKVIDGTGIGYALVAPKICFGTSSLTDITFVETNCKTAWPSTTGFVSTDATAQTKTGVLKLGAAPGSGAADVSLVLDGRIRIEGGGPGANKVLASDGAGGDATWKDAVVDLGLQKAVQGTGCTSGSSITAINPTTGVVTCGKVIKFGTRDGKGAVSVSMPDTSYAVLLDVGGGSTDCRASYATSKTTTGFTISAGDTCGAGTPYTWVAMDY